MKCSKHDDIDAVGTCMSCGRGVCAICRIYYKAKIYCKECIEAGMIEKPERQGASSPRDYFNMVCDRLMREGFKVYNDKVVGIDITVAYKKIWYTGKQFNTFVIMTVMEPLTLRFLEHFSSVALEYAIAYNQGMPRGLSIVTAIPLIASGNIEEMAKFRSMERPKLGLSSFVIPSVYDLRDHRLWSLKKPPLMNYIVFDFHKRLIWRTMQ
jgi:hypothetical protein